MKEKIAYATAALMELMKSGKKMIVAASFGKDSSVALGILLGAAKQLKSEGHEVPMIIVSHGDTLIENPEMRLYADKEIEKVRRYAETHGLNLQVSIARPNLSESWPMRVIGGRALPSFPGTNHDCSVEMKLNPMLRQRKALLGKEIADAVTVIGTRFEESPARAQRMKERGETPYTPWQGDDGAWFISPVAEFSMEDVWEYLGLARANDPEFRTYSDFEDLFRIYADAAGSSCAVVGDIATKGKSKPCGARTGCALCTPIGRDRSLEAMIDGDERYAYMRNLNKLQRFLVNTRWDYSRRNWLGRTVDEDGYIAVQPDAYSPNMLKDLLRYAMTIDVEEQEATQALGIPPRFQLIQLETLIGIDAHWNLHGFHPPFEALRVYRDIYEDGRRYPVPDVIETPKPKKHPKTRYIYVGEDWTENTRLIGLRDPILESITEPGLGCMGTKSTRDGRIVMDVNTDTAFTVSREGANMFMMFELDRVLDEYNSLKRPTGPIDGYLYYVRMGIISLAKQSPSKVDMILRRTWWKWHNGFYGQQDPKDLVARSMPFKQLDLLRAAA